MIKDNTLHFALSKRIMGNAFTGCVVFAAQREGKSSYALQVMYDIYKDWDLVFDHLFFRLDDVVKFLREAVKQEDLVVPIITWDDASVYAGSGLYFRNRDKALFLGALMDTVGSKVKGFLMTTPSPMNLLKSIRNYEFLRVKISKADSNGGRLARGYKNIMLPSTSRRIRKDFIDQYSVMLPTNVYKKYNAIRQSYLTEAVENLGKCMVDDGLSDGKEIEGIKKQGEDMI